MAERSSPKPQLVHDQLDRILASAPFANSHRSQRFLRYVVEGSLKDGEEPLKEYAIAIEVFDRNSSYDPSIDATVRVEAGRLRARLREYYAADGLNDPLLIEVPKGAYRVTFTERAAPDVPVPAPTQPEEALQTKVPAPNHEKTIGTLYRLGWAVAAILVFSASLGYAIFWRNHHLPSPQSTGRAVVLAVLPFANQSGVMANNYLTDGLTDNLIRQLSDLPGLRVVSRAAVDRVSKQSAAHDLGVNVLLTGELQRNADGQLVLNSELSDAKNGTVLRSSQFLPDESDLRPVQADIVQDVVQGLALPLDEREFAGVTRPLTSSPQAFQAFLHGESAALHGSDNNMHVAIHNFEEAIRQDPSFALAYASLAESHTQLGMFFEPPREHLPLARQYAEKALTLDGSLRQAHGTLGLIHLVYDWNLVAAQRELSTADTRDTAIWQLGCTAHLLGSNGHFRHAEEDLERMLEFDPHSALLIGELGCVNYYAGRYSDAVRYYRQSLATDPTSVLANWGLGKSLAGQGHYKEALDALRRFKTVSGFEPPLITAEIGYTEAASGNRNAADAAIAELQRESQHVYVDPYLFAIIYLALKDQDSAYAWLNRCYEGRSPFLISIATDPKWSTSQSDPRFQKLWNRMTEIRQRDESQVAIAASK